MSNFVDNSDIVLDELQGKIQRALESCGLMAEGYAKSELTRQKAVDTGNLRNSVTHLVESDKMYVGTNVYYGPYIEFGTNKMSPRPYIKPSIADHLKEYRQVIESILKE